MTSSRANDHSARQQAARQLIDQTNDVPSLPEAASRVRRIASDPASTVEDLAAALASDPALCAHLLKIANSAYYGLRAGVSSIKHATVLLGRRTIRSLAMAASIQSVFPRREVHPLFSPKVLWTHSVRTAGACSELARILGVADPEDAFVAGLIHDLGLLVEFQHPEKLTLVFDGLADMPLAARREGLCVLQRQHFGADHQDIGFLLLESWDFPPALIEAAGSHHDPLAVEEPSRSLAALVSAVETLGIVGEHGLVEDPPAVEVDPDILEVLGVTAEQFQEHAPCLLEAATQLESAFCEDSSAAA